MTRVARIAAAGCVAFLWSASAAAQAPMPVEPMSAILEAFKEHSLVAMSDAHGNEQNHEFRLALIRDPRFPRVVNDIVLELGNALYQDVADRYVRGEDVPYADLRQIWENTVVQTGGNNYLMIEELLRVVRDVNRTQPAQSRLRILLGDPPIDWNRVRTREEWARFLELRDSYPASLLQLEVIAKQRRALILYGHLHFQRKNIFSNFVMDYWQAQTLVSLIETATATRVFTIWQLDLDKTPFETSKWPVPSVVTIRGTEIGKTDVAVLRSSPNRFTVLEGKMVPVPREEWRALPAEDQFDAILYLGTAATMKNRASYEIPPALCAEPGFLPRQLQRMAVSAPPPEIDHLKKYCAEITGK